MGYIYMGSVKMLKEKEIVNGMKVNQNTLLP